MGGLGRFMCFFGRGSGTGGTKARPARTLGLLAAAVLGAATLTAAPAAWVGAGVAQVQQATPAPAGAALAWGRNSSGQLGDGTTNGSNVPVGVHLPAGTTVTAVAAGDTHSLALTSAGQVLAWGSNLYGQLGDGTTSNSTTPVEVHLPPGTTVTAIAAGSYHSLALTSTGRVLAWGRNNDGQLGDGTTANSTTPVEVHLPAGTTVTAIDASIGSGHSRVDHSLALTSTGLVLAWGRNNDGQLGDGTTTDSSTPVRAHLPTATEVTAIAAGGPHSLALTATGQVLAWGDNAYGQLGNGTLTRSSTPVEVHLPAGVAITAIDGGLYFSLALTSAGRVIAWGDNFQGQLGNGGVGREVTEPVDVLLPAGSTATAIAGGGDHSLAVISTGQVFAWGFNFEGQLGDGTTTQRTVPVAVHMPPGAGATAIDASFFHSLAVVLPEAGPLQVIATVHRDSSDISTDNGYRIEVRNPGFFDALVHEIIVRLPPGFEYTPGSTVGVTGADPDVLGDPASGETLVWHGPFLVPPQSVITIDFNVITSEMPGKYTIDATATADRDVIPADDAAPILVHEAADLQLFKSVPVHVVSPGETFTYELKAHNAGPSDVPHAIITDTLPPGFEFDPGSSSPGCHGVADHVVCDTGHIPAGDSVPVFIEVTVGPEALPGIWYDDAVIEGPLFDPDLGNNSASAEVEVRPRVHLLIAKVASPATVHAGDEVTYTITVHNIGPSAGEATLLDSLPAEMTPVALDGPGCSLGELRCQFPIGPGETVTVHVVARVADDVPGGTVLVNRAHVNAPDNIDPGGADAEAPVTVTESADLAIEKTLVGALVAGEPGHYLIRVTNSGPSLATGVRVTDDLPPGATFDSGASSPECTGPASGPVTCVLGDLRPGDHAEVKVGVHVPTDTLAGTDLTNTATVHGNQPDPNESNNTSSATGTVGRQVYLVFDKLVTDPRVTPGGPISYRVFVGNDGPSEASDVVMTDPLPSEVIGATATVTGGTGTCTSGTVVTCTFPTVPAGTLEIVEITGTVASSATGTIVNTAAVTSAESPTPRSATAVAEVVPLTALVVTKVASDNPVTAGNPLNYTVTVTNEGPSDAMGVALHDPLPAGYTATSATASNGAACTVTGTAVACPDLGTLPQGGSVTVTVDGRTDSSLAPGDLSDTATATDTAGGHAEGRSDVTVFREFAIHVSKTPTVSPVEAGGSAHWTIDVHNAGPSDASGVSVSDLPGSGFTITGLSGPGCDLSSLTCVVPAVPADATVSIEVTAHVDSRATDTVENCAEAFHPEAVPPASSDCSTVPVTRRADLTLSKVSEPETVAAGQPVHYILRVANGGPSAAAPVTVTDTLPAGLTFLPGQSSDGCAVTSGSPATGQTVTCTMGSIEPGDFRDLAIAATTSPSLSGVVTDHATATAPQPGTHPESAATTTIEARADLSITKTASPSFAGAGLTWTIRVTNAGPSDASGAVVSDSLPAGVTITDVITDSGACAHHGRDVTCTLGTITPGGTATVSVVSRTAPDTVPAGQQFTMVTNAASVAYGGDTDPDNNAATFPAAVFAKARVVLVKTVTPEPLTAGGLAAYRVTVTNQGPSVATHVTVTDVLPQPLAFVGAASDPRCSLSRAVVGRVSCVEPGPLGVGASTTFTVVARVAQTLGAGSVLVNDAVAFAAQYDPNPAEAARAVSTVVLPSVPVTG